MRLGWRRGNGPGDRTAADQTRSDQVPGGVDDATQPSRSEPPGTAVPLTLTTRAEAERVVAPAPEAGPAPRQIVRVRPTRGAFTSLPTFDLAGEPAAGGCGCGSGTCGC